MRKTIWLKEEISIAEELLSLAPKLTEEFLDRNDDFINGEFRNGKPYDILTLIQLKLRTEHMPGKLTD